MVQIPCQTFCLPRPAQCMYIDVSLSRDLNTPTFTSQTVITSSHCTSIAAVVATHCKTVRVSWYLTHHHYEFSYCLLIIEKSNVLYFIFVWIIPEIKQKLYVHWPPTTCFSDAKLDTDAFCRSWEFVCLKQLNFLYLYCQPLYQLHTADIHFISVLQHFLQQ